MKIKLRRSIGAWKRGQELTVPKDVSKMDANRFLGLKAADEIDARGKAVPRAGDVDPSRALPNGGPGGSVSASSSSRAARVQPTPIGAPQSGRRRRAAPAS